MIGREAVLGDGSERAVAWAVAPALAVGFGLEPLASAAALPLLPLLAGVLLVATLGAVGLATVHNGLVPCVVLVAAPLAAGALVAGDTVLSLSPRPVASLPMGAAATKAILVVGVAAGAATGAYAVGRLLARVRG